MNNSSNIVEEIAQASWSHWGIENNLHLDVGFREDQWLTRLQVEAANLSQLRRLSANLLKLETESRCPFKENAIVVLWIWILWKRLFLILSFSHEQAL